ncbi:uncharacterized protein [Leptinotarsa decemlineata]|uniref:uncharacterized protein n=1 Tax=Leptinotarsa decemlineata TaxID=7539 RepID=UPI003D304954
MTFRYIFKLCCVYFYLISTPGVCTLDTTNHQISVVLFFADSGKIPSSIAGIKFLEMQEMARVKHSFPSTRDIHSYIAQRNTMNCKELLREGLESLTHFCQNALGMKTATVSVSSKVSTNNIINGESEIPLQMKHPVMQRGTRKFRRSKDSDGILPTMSKIKKVLEKDITSPEHTEVFNIRVKRDGADYGTENKVGEIADVPLGREKTKPPWDVLDVMSHVKFSFFRQFIRG